MRAKGTVKDGTRCYSDSKKLDVCVQRKCQVCYEIGIYHTFVQEKRKEKSVREEFQSFTLRCVLLH